MNRKIFRSVLFSTLIALILSLIAVIFISYSTIASEEHNRIQGTGYVLLDIYETRGLDGLTHLTRHEYRITLINPEGTVLYDSQASDISDNHATREEIKEAMIRGYGESSRYSDTLKERTFYCALKASDGNILRVAITTDTVLAYIIKFSGYLALIFLVVAIICMFTSFKLTKSILQPLYDIDLSGSLSDVDTYPEIMPFLYEIDKRQQELDKQNELLKSRNEEFLTITKSMAEGLVLLNADGIILTINKTARRIFGITDEVIGKSFLTLDRSEKALNFFFGPNGIKKAQLDIPKEQIAAPEEGQALFSKLKVTSVGKSSGRGDKKSCEITKDGRDYQLRFNKIRLNSQTVGFALLIIDVTDTKRAEAQRQEFTANVSHELKTPLQSIMGAAELMESGLVKPEDTRTFAGKIRSQSARLITLIEDIIFLSKLDEMDTHTVRENFPLKPLVQDVFEMLSSKASEKGIKLNLTGDDVSFNGVYRYIYELIYNLTDNAIRYNDKPQEEGYVTVHIKDKNPDELVIEVSDNGIGIAKEHQARIFERFYRVDKSHSRQSGGTGLGLSIVKRVVLFHNGKIKLKSEPGQGSTFKITLKHTVNEEKTANS